MLRAYYFNKVIYKGNINRDFYLFCCRKNIKLYLYIFIHLFYLIMGIFSDKLLRKKQENYYKFLKYIPNKNIIIHEFTKIYKKKITNLYQKNAKNIIIANVPYELVKPFFDKEKIIAYSLDKNNTCDLRKFNEQVRNIQKCEVVYYDKFIDLNSIKSNYSFVVKFNMYFYFKTKVNVCKIFNILKWILFPIIFVGLAFALLLISFTFTATYVDYVMIATYFQSVLLILLNFLPILLLLLFFLFLTKRPWLAFLISSFCIFLIGIVNRTKLVYRDDVLKFEDIVLFKEALIMTSRYKVIILRSTVICFICCIIATIILKKIYKKLDIKNKYSIMLSIILVFISVGVYSTYYTKEDIYNSVGDVTDINVWIATRQSQIRGLIYPLIYSVKEFSYQAPEGYNEKEAKNILSKYSYSDIEDEQKVNIIAVMLEAYNDFSKFDSIPFTRDVYAKFHEIQKKSISGSLVVDIFGGGTVTTEREFLTGFKHLPSFRKTTYSYATYFKEQGYLTEAMHPIYGAFYNRNTINHNLGFDEYYNYDNYFSNINSSFLGDIEFFDYIIDGLKSANAKGNKYFNFSVTYQNHGPYSDSAVQVDYIKKDGISDSTYNMFNRYVDGLMFTNMALYNLVNFLDNYDEPTILIFFGDHNPYLGENNYVYKELGINLDFNSVEGFLNYYTVPYVIHANDAAKKVFNKDFVGIGPTISPIFLMNELFDYLGYDGNEYAKYMSELKSQVDVITEYYYKSDDKYILAKDSDLQDLIADYEKINYYYANK